MLLSGGVAALCRVGGLPFLDGTLPHRLRAFQPQVDVATLPAFERQTRVPILDFVAIPLDGSTLASLERELAENALLIGEDAPVSHLQIGERDSLILGFYDGFHEECVVAYEAMPLGFLSLLKEQGVISNFTSNAVARAGRLRSE